MAINTDNYHSNAIVGQPQVGADIDIFDSSTNPKYAVGLGFTRSDGNKYRYCQFGATTNRALMVATDYLESSLTSTNLNCAAEGLAVTKSGENLAPNAIGSRYTQLIITATAQQFKGAYLSIIGGAGVGHTYRIKGNTATTASTPIAGNIYMDLYDPIQVALNTTTDLLISGCPYSNMEAAMGLTNALSVPLGSTVVGNTSGSYGWICTHGITTNLIGTPTTSRGQMAMISSNTSGALVPVSTNSTSGLSFAVCGQCVNLDSAAGYGLFYLQLE